MKWNEVNLFVNGMKRNEQINERQWNGINQRRTKQLKGCAASRANGIQSTADERNAAKLMDGKREREAAD